MFSKDKPTNSFETGLTSLVPNELNAIPGGQPDVTSPNRPTITTVAVKTQNVAPPTNSLVSGQVLNTGTPVRPGDVLMSFGPKETVKPDAKRTAETPTFHGTAAEQRQVVSASPPSMRFESSVGSYSPELRRPMTCPPPSIHDDSLNRKERCYVIPSKPPVKHPPPERSDKVTDSSLKSPPPFRGAWRP